ncbi:hypothetical protein LCGC14_0898010 [marine sediment metagenome]|uniref:Uncharacterized protein n=1 Tax=marine sediment metagenome TaxID=412755 RepID=A0A0F9PHY6_9ZZZZ
MPILPGERAVVISAAEVQKDSGLTESTEVPSTVLCTHCGTQVMIEAPDIAEHASLHIYVAREVRERWIHESAQLKTVLAQLFDFVQRSTHLRRISFLSHKDPKQLRIVLDFYADKKTVLAWSELSKTLVVEGSGVEAEQRERAIYALDDHSAGGK